VGRLFDFSVKKNKFGGSPNTGHINVRIDKDKVLKQLYYETSNAAFRHRVARHVQDKIFKPYIQEAYRELIAEGLPAVLSAQISGASAYSAPIRLTSRNGPVNVRHKTWESHTEKYRKQLSKQGGKGFFRNRWGKHHKAVIDELLNIQGLKGKFVVSNNLPKKISAVGDKIQVKASVRITHHLKRKDYDNMVKLAFLEGQVTRDGLIYSYGEDQTIGILNAFETGYGGRKGSYSKRRHRPIIGETARAYGATMRRAMNVKLRALR